MGSCYGPKPGWIYRSSQTHHDRCCLPIGQYTLTCLNKKKEYGWGNAFLEIDGKRYCDDFTGFKIMETISVTGKKLRICVRKMSYIELSLLFFLFIHSFMNYS